jgi:hypothetical protein
MFKIYRPCKTDLIRQTFGLAGTAPSMLPVYNSIGLKAHTGYDFQVKCKDNMVKHGGQCEQLYCNIIGSGELTVTYVQKDDIIGYGIIAIDEMWNKFLWWHFDIIDPLIYVGKKMKLGDLLGIAGNTGLSTGAHIHLEYHPYGENPNNGYRGAEDFKQFYDNRFCVDIKTQIELLQKLIEIYKAIVNILRTKAK